MWVFSTYRAVFIAVLLAGIGILASVFIVEYGFGLKPCHLCLYQRIPFVLLILLGGAGLATLANAKISRMLLAACLAVSLASVGLGTYHAGVEKKWFEGPTACSGGGDSASMSLDDLKAQIMAAPMVACNEPAWQWNGITMAGLNAGFSLFLTGFLAYQFWYLRRKSHA